MCPGFEYRSIKYAFNTDCLPDSSGFQSVPKTGRGTNAFVNSLVLAYVYLIFLNENVNKLPPIGDKTEKR